jgi:hypothetical protein
MENIVAVEMISEMFDHSGIHFLGMGTPQLHYLGHTNFLLNLGFLRRKHKFSFNLV